MESGKKAYCTLNTVQSETSYTPSQCSEQQSATVSTLSTLSLSLHTAIPSKLKFFPRMNKSPKSRGPSEGLKNVTHFLMSLVGAPRAPAQFKTNKITQDYKIRKGYKSYSTTHCPA